ncbi:MAG: tRNA pseudouridine(38-40) synthase TruA [Xanthomonadales bacterium]|nr:tRNA pseudouridine synthase A [Xanthomonadales bacterium]MCC6591926.1 tRNA pseudouridine(38-40) synthase TruA [Xanthomonadales bacterium]MCE7930068.1 tRNA pseudouridine(38-40) synthase TruA [Xanthomonadales bacterium PRO6]
MPRYAIGIEYDGTEFLGWQTQHQEPTVQSVLERALAFVADEKVEAVCAGRTDTGVHARGQVAHFDCAAERREYSWLMGVNSRLPASVALRWARPVRDDFHARYAARSRAYRYRILRRATRPALDSRHATWVREPLDVPALRAAIPALIGEHDFTSFRTVACQSRSPVRDLRRIDVREDGEFLDLEFEANAFLHHMIRNLVGSLLVVARGVQPPDWIGRVLAARDRTIAGPTAPAQGLTFLAARYPTEWGLPPEHTL